MYRVVCCLLLCWGLTACWGNNQTPAQSGAIPTSPAALKQAPPPDLIRALGILQPRQTRTLRFAHEGMVRSAVQQVGATVQMGEPVAVMESTDLTLALSNAEAAITIHQAELTQVEGNPHHTQPELVIAQAQLQQAQIAREQVALQLTNALLTAPFTGVVSAIHAHPGEMVSAGQPVVELIDTGGWLVETNNVSELTISRIALGQPVAVNVIVFPGQPLTGTVMAIDPIAIVQQGDTTYTLYIALAPTALPLLTGMNVEIEITANE